MDDKGLIISLITGPWQFVLTDSVQVHGSLYRSKSKNMWDVIQQSQLQYIGVDDFPCINPCSAVCFLSY